MRLAIFREFVEVASIEELHAQLQSRENEKFGSFWLWHEIGTELSMMVNGPDAYLFYIAADGRQQHSTLDVMLNPHEPRLYAGGVTPSLYSSYSEDTDNPEELIKFLADNHERTPMPRQYTVRVVDAMAAIDEFFVSGERSTKIQWYRLVEAAEATLPRKPWWRFW